MDEKVKAKWKDRILQYLYEERNYAIPVSDIASVVSKGALTAKEVMDLCHEIESNNLNLLTERTSGVAVAFQANEDALLFLDNDSFVERIKHGDRTEKIKERNQRERDKRQDEHQALQVENTRLSIKLNRQKIKTHWAPIIISGISLIVAAWSLFKPEPTNEKLDQLKIELEKMNVKLNNQKDSLWDVIDKLKMPKDTVK